jgi:hypothetical protein
MRLEQLIDKLERASKKYERKIWGAHGSDIETYELCELLKEAAQQLKAHAYHTANS